MNTKIALSTVSILAALTLMGGATYAAFTSSASNNGNTFTAGNMILNINGAPGSASTPIFNVLAAAPGDATSSALILKNTGSVGASTVQVSSINVGGTNPDLGNKLTLQIFDDTNSNGLLDGGETILGAAHITDPGWMNYVLPGVTLGAGVQKDLGAKITFDSDSDNTYQGKSAEFNLNFQANQ